MRPYRVLLLTPPMVQFNTPYAATPLLTAVLRRAGVDAVQADLSLALALRLLSRRGLEAARAEIARRRAPPTPAVAHFLAHASRYAAAVGPLMAFLQGRRPDLAGPIARRRLLPEGPRFRVLDDLARIGMDPAGEGAGALARFLGGLCIDDLADAIREGVDPRFGLSRYAERLTAAAPSFTPIDRALRAAPTLIDTLIDDLADRLLRRTRPDLVGVTIPFPGNVYAAFRIARRAKAWDPSVRTVAGGGFVNTELAELSDPRVFDSFDFLTYDDGEQPLLRLVEHLTGRATEADLIRTRLRRGRSVRFVAGPPVALLRHRDRPPPCYDGLPLHDYPGVTETLNPMSRLWTERRWLKLQLAHGCYWHRCAFCDTKLDYIARYDPADAATVVGWMEKLIAETGETGFHFADEAAPPALLRRLAEAILARGLKVTWWTNVRLEPAFTPSLARLLARSGCIAVTGGLECAERGLLARMRKGITLEQAARATRAFSRAGIMVHLYLMYGFPGQTVAQTVDALEFVRQLFGAGFVQSAYWHRFALTVHSSLYDERDRYGIAVPARRAPRFARNEVPFAERRAPDHEALGQALHKAVYNFMHGVGLDEDVRAWFDGRVPAPRLRPDAVARSVRDPLPVANARQRATQAPRPVIRDAGPASSVSARHGS